MPNPFASPHFQSSLSTMNLSRMSPPTKSLRLLPRPKRPGFPPLSLSRFFVTSFQGLQELKSALVDILLFRSRVVLSWNELMFRLISKPSSGSIESFNVQTFKRPKRRRLTRHTTGLLCRKRNPGIRSVVTARGRHSIRELNSLHAAFGPVVLGLALILFVFLDSSGFLMILRAHPLSVIPALHSDRDAKCQRNGGTPSSCREISQENHGEQSTLGDLERRKMDVVQTLSFYEISQTTLV